MTDDMMGLRALVEIEEDQFPAEGRMLICCAG